MHYPVPNNESERLEALHRLRILGTQPTPEFDSVVDMAALIFDAPIALVSFVDQDRQWFKAKVGLQESQTCRDVAFCNYTILADDVFEVQDTHQDDRFRHNSLVTGRWCRDKISTFCVYAAGIENSLIGPECRTNITVPAAITSAR